MENFTGDMSGEKKNSHQIEYGLLSTAFTECLVSGKRFGSIYPVTWLC
jgi:hypothetical protein